MIFLGLDFETTGLDLELDCVIEVGLVLWDSQSSCALALDSFLIQPGINISPKKWLDIYNLTKIEERHINEFGMSPNEAIIKMHHLMKQVDAVVAFNGNKFDKLMYYNWAQRNNMIPYDNIWIDPRVDGNKPINESQILHSANNGFVNPFPHRAVTDVLSMFKNIILDGENLEDMLLRAKIPSITVYAGGLPYNRKDEAKERGYFWDGLAKCWKKEIKICDFESEVKNASFKVIKL